MTDGDGIDLVQRARRALIDDARRERTARWVAVGGALAMSALALVISAWGAQWQAELIVTDARAQRAAVATVELDDANRRLSALGLPQIVMPPGAQADELFLAALRGQTAADRAEERRALGQPIDPGPDPLVPPPALTGPSTAAPGATTTGPTSPSTDSAPPTATGPPAPPSDTESSAPPLPTATPGTDTGAAPSPGPTTSSTEAPPTDAEPPASSVPEPGPAPEAPPQDPPPGGGLLPLLPGLRLPGIGPLL